MADSYKQKVPLTEKVLLTMNEAADYIGIGHTTLRNFLDGREEEFCVQIGNRMMVKREKIRTFINDKVTVM